MVTLKQTQSYLKPDLLILSSEGTWKEPDITIRIWESHSQDLWVYIFLHTFLLSSQVLFVVPE